MSELVLTGLDGANPLGLLAALGVLDVLAEGGAPARLHWQDVGGWRPVVSGFEGDLPSLLQRIDEDRIACLAEPALALEYDGKQDLKPPPTLFHNYLESLVEQATPAQRRGVDWAAAFATDVAVDNNGNTKPTAFHFTAGNQLFLRMVNDLAAGTTTADIEEALIGPWHYARPLPVMSWDNTVSRDYALRASNPAKEKKLGVPGADWLAVRGLRFLPSFPVGDRIKTTGCSGGWKTGSFCWPLWTVSLTPEVARSTLRLGVADLSQGERAARGIGVVFRSGIKRSDQGGYGSFEPAAVA